MKSPKLILFLTVFMDMMGFSVIFPLFPETLKFYLEKGGDPILDFFINILKSSSVDEDNKYFIVLFGGLVGSIYAILQFVFAPLWGKLSDKYGRKRILEFTSFGSFLGYTLWLFSSSFSLFVLSRVITGTMGGNISVASAAMADLTPEKERARGMGIIGAGIGLGFIFGPPIGGLLSGFHFSEYLPIFQKIPTTVFGLSALLSIFVAFVNLNLVLWVFPETHKANRETTQRAGHPVFGIFSSKNRYLPSISFIYFLFTLGFSGFEFSVNFFFSEALSFSPKQIGLTFLYMGGIVILIQGGVIRRISGKISEKKISLTGSVFLMIGFSMIYLSTSVFMVFSSLFFLSTGSALLNPGLSALASVHSNSDEQGINLGILRGFGSLARAFAPFLFSILYFWSGAKTVFGTSFVVIVLVAAFLLRFEERKSE